MRIAWKVWSPILAVLLAGGATAGEHEPESEGDVLARGSAGALRLASTACEQGSLDGCKNARAILLEQQDSVCAEADTAVAPLAHGCDAGRLTACAALAVAHRLGMGVPADADRALALAQRACDGHDALGCEVLRPLRLTVRQPSFTLGQLVDIARQHKPLPVDELHSMGPFEGRILRNAILASWGQRF